ncbi:DnaJ domain-containing protein [Natronolimnohabitans sp. A-GB9]|uniref:DnaJ domain-containing protein n=1 Tax=Natronolimnohabitans sp. A-GB9 TaxID=3069757 RepID=UPI0027B715DA|nr:DnaJ domain-containing protein [Natronolimnohabitans sp. A-GB9]MDQ2051316.1 DnaJ domain-containing protein [Natronolimnohabitans sp. A-GB9]
MTEDFYDLLDVPTDASQDEIKAAYREQVRVYHPDHNDDDRARAQFTAVKKAYDILGDPVERQAYDRLGHEEYVAKRTSGLPSPDVWRSGDDSTEETDDDSSSSERTSSERTSRTSRTASASTTGATSTGTASTGTGSSRSTSTGSSSSRATGTTSGTAGTSKTAGNTSSTSTRATDTATATTGTGRDTASDHDRDRSQAGDSDSNAVVRWWRRRNFSLPLIWLSVLLYLGGLGHFALVNESGLETLRAELVAVGTDPNGVLETLSSGRYGIASTVEYLAAFELVAPPLEAELWYGTLAGVVGLTLVAILGARAYRDGETWGPVSIDETIVVALAVTVTTGLVGGPLLAGAVLMPLLFGVVVRHTRRGPGWKPSYLYVVPVLAPLAGLAVTAAGEATLAVDLLAFVVLPLIGALGLPLRATVRKRFGK